MKKLAYVLSVVMVLAMASVGLAGELTDVAEKAAMKVEDADSLDDKTIELTGSVLQDNTFVDENGQSYELAANEANKVCKSLVGEKIKVQATVMEQKEGLKSMIVSSYEIIK
jgi:hypothetical protein